MLSNTGEKVTLNLLPFSWLTTKPALHSKLQHVKELHIEYL